MNLIIWVVASLTGYLSGSFSAARAVVRIFAPGHKLEGMHMEVPGGQARFESEIISATTVRLQLGPRYGCLTAVLDILKAALPALLFRFHYPDGYYYLAAAGFATVGHIWPIYHRFKGGRGLSPILGGMLVMDWVGVIITQLIGGLIGVATKNDLILTWIGTALMIPWVWFRTHSWEQVFYLVLMNGLFWYAMFPELRQMRQMKEDGLMEEFADAEQVRVVGRRGDEVIPTMRYSNLKYWFQSLVTRSKEE